MSNAAIEGKGHSRPLFAFDYPGLRVVAFIAAAAVMLPIAALIVLVSPLRGLRDLPEAEQPADC